MNTLYSSSYNFLYNHKFWFNRQSSPLQVHITTHPKIMLCKIKKEPNFAISMRKEHTL